MRYEYRCRIHGPREVEKPATESGRVEYCPACANDTLPLEPMRRVYSAQSIIMRPTGYHLRPGDHGYGDFDRAIELGEVRDPDAASQLGRGATVSSRLQHEPMKFDEDHMQRFHEAARAVHSEIVEG